MLFGYTSLGKCVNFAPHVLDFTILSTLSTTEVHLELKYVLFPS